ncbi:hypothetical protein SAMN05216548_10417 [Faunimonas pinastri]|uniref:Uncharacterized protein n=2 Tax=Faunimonas pinastri TaxID=1855383 RepID=A0A1H9F6E3_9HYPH|nr:hypothetical protein SAMN05216548_10417 [Faunimonas pinastri]
MSRVKGVVPLAKATAQDRHPNNRRRIQRNGSDWFDFMAEQPERLAEELANELLGGTVWLDVPRGGSETPYLR